MDKQDINIEVVSIDDLVQDDHNFNRGSEEGAQLIARSFREHGAGRSVLLDKNNRLIAGNKAAEGAIASGIKRVCIIETTGDELVAVKRTDIDLDSAEGRQMAYLDNLTQQVSLTWDQTELEAVQADVEGFEVSDFGYEIDSLPQVQLPTEQGTSQQKDPTNSELDVDGFGDKIKMVLELSIEEHAFIQQRLSQDGMTKEQVLLNILGYGTEQQ